jgi:serine/threonine-protein kinase
LYVRNTNDLTAKPVAGTEGASSPFFSPDGNWVAFFADGRLNKMLLDGGDPVTLCRNCASNPRGGAWSD